MKVHKYSRNKNILVLSVLAGIMLMPYTSFFVPKAEAQYQFSGGAGAGGSGAIGGYISGLAPAIAQIPGCRQIAGNFIKNLFTSKATKAAQAEAKRLAEEEAKKELAKGLLGGIVVTDPAVIDAVTKNRFVDQQTADHLASLENKKSCTDAIGKMVVKLMLQKLTVATVDLINTGRFGDSFYVKNSNNTFLSIAEREILGFNGEVLASGNPFGKAFIQGQAQAFKLHFQDNAQYSLNKLIAETNPDCRDNQGNRVSCDLAFQGNFSAGGWGAWDALTQVPANNPLGFQLLASNEISKRLAGTEQSTAQNIRDELQQAGGFLGQQRCAIPSHDITPSEDKKGAAERASVAVGPWPDRICLRWEYVTPGLMIAESAQKITHYQDNQYLKAEDLNDAIAAIGDAFLNKWFGNTNGSNGGFANADIQNAGGTFQYDIENGSNSFAGQNQIERDFPSYLTSTWLEQNPDFNIRTDLNQALIDVERTYRAKLQDQNVELWSKTPSGGNYGLLPIIYQLDYCIPGPHPGFEEDARASMEKALSQGGLPQGSKLLNTISSVPLVGGIVSTVIDDLFGLFTGDTLSNSEMQKANVNVISQFAGVTALQNSNVQTFDQVQNIYETIVEQYIKVIHTVFSGDLMPSATGEAANEFNKAKGYEQIKKDNDTEIITMTGVVKRLAEIKDGVDKLNLDLANHTVKNASGQIVGATDEQNQYEENLKTFITEFGRLSAQMVSGDDVAVADNLTKEIKDEEKYVYNDLLKGPDGCEQELYKKVDGSSQPQMPWQMTDSKRLIYPFPILYDYNNYPRPSILPDPLYNSNSLFTISHPDNKAAYDNRGTIQRTTGGLGYGTSPLHGMDNTQITFCQSISSIIGADVSGCSNYVGPNFIHITNLMTIFDDPNDVQVLEHSLGLY